MVKNTTFMYLESSHWSDYALLDSGDGQKLERFGSYIFIRPEVQSMWSRGLPEAEWSRAHAVFQPTREESGGHWEFKQEVAERWKMQYGPIKFWAMTTSGRHLGVFPECAENWDWVADIIRLQKRPVNVLNLFGYTGLATLSAAAAGALVTHVDASKKAVAWARENQVLSGLTEKPVRWIVEDALKFVQREARRGKHYDGIVLDPPKFGRGPKGEIWEVYKSLPNLLRACRKVMSEQPLFMIITIYAVKASAIHVEQTLAETLREYTGGIESGELVVREQSTGRMLSQAVFARWCAK
jgi:23S rRNA (cytosine1962-C5)-methyltransferase